MIDIKLNFLKLSLLSGCSYFSKSIFCGLYLTVWLTSHREVLSLARIVANKAVLNRLSFFILSLSEFCIVLCFFFFFFPYALVKLIAMEIRFEKERFCGLRCAVSKPYLSNSKILNWNWAWSEEALFKGY